MVGNGINKLFERALPEGEKTEENVLRVRKEFIPYYDVHNAPWHRSIVLLLPGKEHRMIQTFSRQGYN